MPKNSESAAMPQADRLFLHHIWLLLMLLLGLTLANTAQADDAEVGMALLSVGAVTATARDGSVRSLARGSPIFNGETLRTGPTGRLQIRFTDGSRMALRPDSELLIDDYAFQEQAAPEQQRTNLSLNRGGFRTVTGQVAASNRAGYRIATPFAVVGVRGTDFSAVIVDDDGAGEKLFLVVAAGGIFAENDAGSLDLGSDAEFDIAVVTAFDAIPEGLDQLPGPATDAFDIPIAGADDDATAAEDATEAGTGDETPAVVIGEGSEDDGDVLVMVTAEGDGEDEPIFEIRQRCL